MFIIILFWKIFVTASILSVKKELLRRYISTSLQSNNIEWENSDHLKPPESLTRQECDNSTNIIKVLSNKNNQSFSKKELNINDEITNTSISNPTNSLFSDQKRKLSPKNQLNVDTINESRLSNDDFPLKRRRLDRTVLCSNKKYSSNRKRPLSKRNFSQNIPLNKLNTPNYGSNYIITGSNISQSTDNNFLQSANDKFWTIISTFTIINSQSYTDEYQYLFNTQVTSAILNNYMCKILDNQMFFKDLSEKNSEDIVYHYVLNQISDLNETKSTEHSLLNELPGQNTDKSSIFVLFKKHLTNIRKFYLDPANLELTPSNTLLSQNDYQKLEKILISSKTMIHRFQFTEENAILAHFSFVDKLVEIEDIFIRSNPENNILNLLSKIEFQIIPELRISNEIYMFITKYEIIKNISSCIKENHISKVYFLVYLFNFLSKKFTDDILRLNIKTEKDLYKMRQEIDNNLLLENALILRKILLKINLCLKNYDSIATIYGILIWIDYILDKNESVFAEKYSELKIFIRYCFESIMNKKIDPNNRFLTEILAFATVLISNNLELKALSTIF